MKKPTDRLLSAAIIIILVFLIFTAFMLTTSANEKNIALSARSASLYEPTTKTFLFAKNADERLPMASTTKIMTALVALENTRLDEQIYIPSEACGVEGSSLYLTPGEILTAKDLLYGLMLRSANDAAVAIACHVAGNIESFSSLMNEKAANLGLKNTNFENPHGLDSQNHYTTARELAIISAEALKSDTFREIVSTKSAIITNTEGFSRTIVNHNKLLRLYDGAIGVKTGYTKKSGRSLVGAAQRDEITLVSVTLDAPDDWNDHAKLLDRGFSSLSAFSLSEGERSYSLPIISGTRDRLSVYNSEGFKTVYETSSEAPQIRVELPRYVAAPIKKGQKIGKLSVIKDGAVIFETDMIAAEDINFNKKRTT